MAPADTQDVKPGPAVGNTIYEVQGLFPSDAALQDAIARLTLKGFDRADFSLPQTRPTTAEATPDQGAENPTTETDTRQIRNLTSSTLGVAGAIAAAGVTVATGGTAAVAGLAAAAVGAGVGLTSEAVNTVTDKANHEERETAAREGRLVLSVRTPDEAAQNDVVAAMREAGASRVEPVTRIDNAIQSTGWTG